MVDCFSGFLISSHWAVQPGQVFSFSCEESSSLVRKYFVFLNNHCIGFSLRGLRSFFVQDTKRWVFMFLTHKLSQMNN